MKHLKDKKSKIEIARILGGHMFSGTTDKTARSRLRLSAQAAKVGSTKGGGGDA